LSAFALVLVTFINNAFTSVTGVLVIQIPPFAWKISDIIFH
jgi:hypothetical protein